MNKNNNIEERVEVVCIKCGGVDFYPFGYLTEKACKEYRCPACRQVVAELSVQERERDRRKLLVEDNAT